MPLSASQHRKAVREGKIPDEGKREEGRGNRGPRPEARSLFRKGIDFAKAMTSGPASAELKAARLAVCAACPTDQRYDKDGHDHCRACGCPAYRLSRLEFKAGLAMDTCTEGHWKGVKSEAIADC